MRIVRPARVVPVAEVAGQDLIGGRIAVRIAGATIAVRTAKIAASGAKAAVRAEDVHSKARPTLNSRN